jgi:hypothetical protein
MRVKKLRAKGRDENVREEECDRWFNHARPMTRAQKTWKEKCIKKEEKGDDSDNNNSPEDSTERMVTDVNMVFQLPSEFCLLEPEAAQLTLGQHMKPLYIKGHLDGRPINRMQVNGCVCVNIMPTTVFE